MTMLSKGPEVKIGKYLIEGKQLMHVSGAEWKLFATKIVTPYRNHITTDLERTISYDGKGSPYHKLWVIKDNKFVDFTDAGIIENATNGYKVGVNLSTITYVDNKFQGWRRVHFLNITKFKVGDIVEVDQDYRPRHHNWLPATVVSENKNGTYNLKYDAQNPVPPELRGKIEYGQAVAEIRRPLRLGWVSKVHTSGKTFYRNSNTGVTQWEHPGTSKSLISGYEIFVHESILGCKPGVARGSAPASTAPGHSTVNASKGEDNKAFHKEMEQLLVPMEHLIKGDSVTIHDLEKTPYLNGLKGTIDCWNSEMGQWDVTLTKISHLIANETAETEQTIQARPANLDRLTLRKNLPPMGRRNSLLPIVWEPVNDPDDVGSTGPDLHVRRRRRLPERKPHHRRLVVLERLLGKIYRANGLEPPEEF